MTAPLLNLSGGLARAVALKTAIATAAGLGLVFGTGTAAWAGLQHQAKLATERIGLADQPAPARDGLYLSDGNFVPRSTRSQRAVALRLAMLGDSSSAGFGAADPDGVPGVMLARGLAETLRRPVHLTTHAVIGSGAADLERQCTVALADRPHLVLIIVGPNDVRTRVSPSVSATALEATVAQLRERDITVVVGTCPDLSVIAPIPQPLRRLAGYWSRTLALKQDQAVRRAGGDAVAMGRIVSPEFLLHPELLFSADQFHPSGAGYARAVAALLPVTVEALRTQPLQLVPVQTTQPQAAPRARRASVGNAIGAAAVGLGDPALDLDAKLLG